MTTLRAALCLLAATGTSALADPPRIESVEATRAGQGWRFDVTLSHGDTGWDDYADGWRIEAPDGTVLGTRDLLHPHVEEQPFTRSLTGVAIPDDLSQVQVRARDSVGGWGAATVTVDLPRD